MTYWPKWLRNVFIASGGLFVLAVSFSVYILNSHAAVPPLSMTNPLHPSTAEQPGSHPIGVLNIITGVTGLLTAASALYGQILAGRKQKMDYDLAKQQMKLRARNAAAKKTNRKKR